jgi:hypothetical protein
MKESYILSPWRARKFDYYTRYYRISLNNIIRAEHIVGHNSNHEFWIVMGSIDRELISAGYKLCSSEDGFDKYRLLV